MLLLAWGLIGPVVQFVEVENLRSNEYRLVIRFNPTRLWLAGENILGN